MSRHGKLSSPRGFPASLLKKLKRPAQFYFLISGVLFNIFALWTLAGWPLFFDRLLIRSEAPSEAAYIVCVGGGLTGGNLPTDEGFQRIYTAVQLYLDGYGDKIIFTGGGAGTVSEAEVYAEAASWLGCLKEDAVLDPGPNITAEHPKNILKIEGLEISIETPLNIVTSVLHSRRTALCFKKFGYSDFRMVTEYRATGRMAEKPLPDEKLVTDEKADLWANAEKYVRENQTSRIETYRPSGKSYADIFNRLKWRLSYFFTALRELGALAWYKVKGYI